MACVGQDTHTHLSISQPKMQINTAFLEGGGDDERQAEDSVTHPTLSPLDDVTVMPGTLLMQQMQNDEEEEEELSRKTRAWGSRRMSMMTLSTVCVYVDGFMSMKAETRNHGQWVELLMNVDDVLQK